MSIFTLQIEPHLAEAFFHYLKQRGYLIYPPVSPSSPQVARRGSSRHTISTKPTGTLVVSIGLHLEAMKFLTTIK